MNRDEGYNFDLLMNNDEFLNSKNAWNIPIGISESGNIVFEDFNDFNNMLVSGVTGFGKTSFVQSIIAALMTNNSPDSLKFVVYDSKIVDYSYLNGSPYLLLPVITDEKRMERALNWLLDETQRRLLFLSNKVENTKSFKLFVIVDDFYSCYNSCTEELEELLINSRIIDIHYIIVSSAFTRKTLSKELSSNLLSRASFYLVDKNSSRFILDEVGAEQLTNPGTMIYKRPGLFLKCKAIYVDNDEMQKKCLAKDKNHDELYSQDIIREIECKSIPETEIYDKYFEEAARFVIEKNKASIGYLQRMLRIGFNQAARIMDQLEEFGVVGPEVGTKPRKILMGITDFENKYNSL